MNRAHHTYHVVVKDPKTGTTVDYTVRAVSDEHADRQGRDGYTGLLGHVEETQKRLEVTTRRIRGT